MATQTKIPPLTVSNPWWGHDPSDKQWLGLYAYEECPDLFYGGAAGPGKTSFLLMAAVQYVHYPHYRALILRKTFADLSLPDAIMDRAISWWDGVEGATHSLFPGVQPSRFNPFRAAAARRCSWTTWVCKSATLRVC